ncbi:4-hydroxybenzoate polyprenyltransferase, mitochondrial [Mycena venus]|uniref:4-hydroxybenzoate polyprenyltransferase, mitochondrial n=1 Tax=Mycena venus TaxID=2733690 RepID=A0A8H6X656_9AGAR|nr:4-hydroxybenzoate polyprenyltransferase, mitochondrial [Mycena venus]
MRPSNISRSHKASPNMRSANKFSSLQSAARTLQGYSDLIRFSKPAATFIIFMPFGQTMALASYAHGGMQIWDVVRWCGLFLLWAFVGRSLACTVNDVCDRDVDGKVARTKTRPLPSGRVSVTGARLFLLAQVCLDIALYYQISTTVLLHGLVSLGLSLLYPLMKRFTNWPQAWLGVAANYGVFLAWASLPKGPDISIAVFLLIGLAAWTVCFDTIYALQDREDDLKLGVGSSAITAFGYMEKFLWFCAIVFVACLIAVGILNRQGPIYFIVSVGVVAFAVFRHLLGLDMTKRESFADALPLGAGVSFIVLGGIVGDCLVSQIFA